jgi:hypothetical protein
MVTRSEGTAVVRSGWARVLFVCAVVSSRSGRSGGVRVWRLSVAGPLLAIAAFVSVSQARLSIGFSERVGRITVTRSERTTVVRSDRDPVAVAFAAASSRFTRSSGVRAWRWTLAGPLLAIALLLSVVPLALGRVRPAVIERELTAEVALTEAKLGALVNPGGAPATYRFEYGTSTAYDHSTPFPEGSVGEGSSSRAVWAAASDLAPGTTYHYRVVVTNEGGVATGPDQIFTTLTPEQASCPNGEFRGGFSAALPDCRAYELVTPPVQNSSQVDRAGPVAAGGDAVAFITKEPLPGAPTGGESYLVRRGPGGWVSEDVIPAESYTGTICVGRNAAVSAWSQELARTVVAYGNGARESEEAGGPGKSLYEACNADGLQIVPGEPVGYENLLLRDNVSASFRWVNAPEGGLSPVPADARFRGASADLSHVIFSERSPLTSDASYGLENLYEWDEGVLRLLTVLPEGATTTGSLVQAVGRNAISADGSHIFFTAGGGLYVRIDGERTVQVDRTRGSGSSGGGSFQAASWDGSRVFFIDESTLTTDSTAQAGEPDLYECVLPAGASECELTDLTVAKAGEHADVLAVSPLGSRDSGHVYFLATGVLASNKREYKDAHGKLVVETAQPGQRNLYAWSNGTITFVATLGTNGGVGEASPDGAWFAFGSSKSLTGYDNTASSGQTVGEIFLYSTASGRLVCASCNPTGEAPIANEGGAILSAGGLEITRPLSDGGRLFFDTHEALVPSDTDGQQDVYEYENGQAYLITSGTSQRQSTFVGASETGDDVFFESFQQLLPQDTQEDIKVIYDARVNGGITAPASPPQCATADACRTPVSLQPSIYGAPSSQTFTGAGNLTPPAKQTLKSKRKTVCKRGFVKKRGGCVKRRSKGRARKSDHRGRRLS